MEDPIYESLCVIQHLWKDLIFAKVYRSLKRQPEGFYGFASLVDAPERNAYFQSGDYREPDLDQSISFTLLGRRAVFEEGFQQPSPPMARIGQQVCGIPENGPKGLRFRCWFYCSREFLNLWHLLVHGPAHPIFDPIGSDQDAILASLAPPKGSSSDNEGNLRRWPALYQALALLLVFRQDEGAQQLTLPPGFIDACLTLYKTHWKS